MDYDGGACKLSKRLEEIILENYTRGPEEKGFWWQGTWWSRRAFMELVEGCTRGLEESGFGDGDRLALAVPNSPLFWALAVAVWRRRGCIVPLNLQAGARAILRALEFVEVSGVVLLEGREDLGTLIERRNIPVDIVSLADGLPAFKIRKVEPTPADLAVIFFTSGTTSDPKAVQITHENLRSNAEGILEQVPMIREDDVMLNVLPNFHALGFTVCGLLPLILGMPQVVLPTFMPPEATLDAIRDGGVTIVVGVPTMFSFLIQAIARGAAAPKGLRLIVSGGDRMPLPLDERCAQILGVGVLEGYGLSETSPVVSVNPDYSLKKLGTVGTLLPGYEMRVLDDEGRSVAVGQEGTLWVRGDSVTPGYFHAPKLNGERFSDGWFNTGDVVRVDEDGFITIVARVSDIIIVGGFNVYPREVEDVLNEHPGVMQSAVVGVPHSVTGEIVKACIIPKPGVEISSREIQNYCRERLAHFKVPRVVKFYEDFPRSSIGEVLKRELR